MSILKTQNSVSWVGQGFPKSIKRWGGGGKGGRTRNFTEGGFFLIEGKGGRDLHKEFFFNLLRLL